MPRLSTTTPDRLLEDHLEGGRNRLYVSMNPIVKIVHSKNANAPVEIHPGDLFCPEMFRETGTPNRAQNPDGKWMTNYTSKALDNRRFVVPGGYLLISGDAPDDWKYLRANFPKKEVKSKVGASPPA